MQKQSFQGSNFLKRPICPSNELSHKGTRFLFFFILSFFLSFFSHQRSKTVKSCRCITAVPIFNTFCTCVCIQLRRVVLGPSCEREIHVFIVSITLHILLFFISNPTSAHTVSFYNFLVHMRFCDTKPLVS